MSNIRRKTLSILIVFSLFIGMVGIVNVDTSYAASKKLKIATKTVSLTVGGQFQQKLLNKKGKAIKAKKVKWKSKNNAVATINKKGKITAVKAGTAKMTAKYQGKTYRFTVNVRNAQPFVETTGISFDGERPVCLHVGDKYQLKAIVSPSNATNKTVNWYYNNDPTVASIDNNGLVTAKKEGETFVSAATYNYKYTTDIIYIRVSNYNQKITLSTNSIELKPRQTIDLKVHTDRGNLIACEESDLNAITSYPIEDTLGVNEKTIHIYACPDAKEGVYTVKVRDIDNPRVYVILSVKVTSNESGIQHLYNYISENGYTNNNGEKTVKLESSSDNKVYLVASDNEIDFVFGSESVTDDITANYSAIMTLSTSDTNSHEPIIVVVNLNGSSLFANTFFNTATYTFDTNDLYFEKDKNCSWPDSIEYQDLCNATFSLAMINWEKGIYRLTGMKMKDIGFYNYEIHL